MDLSLGLGLIIVNDWLLLFIGLLVAFYYYSTWHFDFFTSRGIPGPKPYPVVGTVGDVFTRGIIEAVRESYSKYGKVYGSFAGRNPTLNVSDEEMLKEILVKQFHAFTNRNQNFNLRHEVTSNFLTNLTDENWKRVRNLLTPTFTSGKLKYMSRQINHAAKLLASNVGEYAEKGEQFEVKELGGAFTMDVIATTAFGLQINSQKDPNTTFVKMGKKIFKFSFFNLGFIVAFFFPALLPVLGKVGYSLFPKDVLNFFTNILEQIIEGRKEGGQIQKDFMQLMINAHKVDFDQNEVAAEVAEGGAVYDVSQPDSQKGLSKNEVLAQGILFFLAGYETTANAVTLLLYSLAINPDCQEKLYNEIQEVIGDNEDISYEKISEMHYLEMCLLETLRKYPGAPVIDRTCGKDMTIKGVQIPKGTVVAIPILGIHHDPEIYPDPEKFIPERFTPEEKAKRSPYHFMPFGYGPRNCIGMRLALIEAQMAVAHVIRKYKLVPSEKTEIPIKFKKIGFQAENGVWIKAEKRQ